MTPGEAATSPRVARVRSGGRFTRPAALGALALVILAIIVLLLSGGGGNHYRLLFQGGGQLVPGNQVLIGGVPVGSVDDVKLIDTGQAEVDISVNHPLHEGSTAIIRATSLSGIANRYVSIQPGPDNNPQLADDAIISEVDTTTPVDLDQLFNALRGPERQALRNIIQGSATAYAGKGPEANQTYKYLSPSLVATDRLLQELDRDEGTLTSFLVNGASVVTSVAERRNDLSALTQNTNVALGAIASQNQSFDRALVALPGALRQANTTFHNLRPTLDDLTPFIDAAKTGTKDLPTFLKQLKPVVTRSVPVFRDLNRAVNLKGKNNDLADVFANLPATESAASSAVGPSVQALNDALPTLTFIRPYTPDLLGAVGKLGQVTGYYDADGHYARVQPAGLGIYHYNPGTQNLEPIGIQQQFDDYCLPAFPGASIGTAPCTVTNPLSSNFKVYRRCPGGTTQTAIDLSNPFVAPLWPGSNLTSPAPPNDCTATDQPLGP
jgi:phospholipid/cholesterol/gamma-HCH transport system substrate-binding protein